MAAPSDPLQVQLGNPEGPLSLPGSSSSTAFLCDSLLWQQTSKIRNEAGEATAPNMAEESLGQELLLVAGLHQIIKVGRDL